MPSGYLPILGYKEETRTPDSGFQLGGSYSLCEYCHSPERISSVRFTIDHVQPQSLNGSDDFDNLALACSRCNQRRYNFINGKDTQTDLITALFNPRQQVWSEHFAWSADRVRLVGITPTGRATCDRLDINDDRESVSQRIIYPKLDQLVVHSNSISNICYWFPVQN